MCSHCRKSEPKVAVLSAEAVPKPRVDPGLGTAHVCAAGGRKHKDIELMLGTVSAALKLSKYISFYPFRNVPLAEPSLPLVNYSLSLGTGCLCRDMSLNTH